MIFTEEEKIAYIATLIDALTYEASNADLGLCPILKEGLVGSLDNISAQIIEFKELQR